ncbi:hypothetical protein KKF61_01610 [Patescibacteria group bacterium]|nr:hypothetical protein [Patescibacteria group bacterium]
MQISGIVDIIEHMKAKYYLYRILSVILMVLLSYIIHALAEILWLKYADDIIWYNHLGIGMCALHPIFQYTILILGIIGGFFIGKVWWRIVYIEKRHWRFKKDKN